MAKTKKEDVGTGIAPTSQEPNKQDFLAIFEAIEEKENHEFTELTSNLLKMGQGKRLTELF